MMSEIEQLRAEVEHLTQALKDAQDGRDSAVQTYMQCIEACKGRNAQIAALHAEIAHLRAT